MDAKRTVRMAFVALLVCLAGVSALAKNGIQVDHLRCEYLGNPLGLDVIKPRLSWVIRIRTGGRSAGRLRSARGLDTGNAGHGQGGLLG